MAFGNFYLSLDDDSGKRGKQFEHFVKWFLVKDPEWATQVRHVWLWEEFPQRWGPDCGIDLVFEHRNGELWAVQAKCYSPQYDITKHDVDKFLSESNRSLISKRLLISTTDGIGTNAIKVCEAQEKPVVRFHLSDFEKSNIDYPASILELGNSGRKIPPKPRDHQVEAIDSVNLGLKSNDRGQLIMACGTGKTFTTLWIKEKLNAQKVLVLLPSLSLLAQTLREWTFAANQTFDVLCVCSDKSVGKRDSDEIVTRVGEVPFPVTSSIEEIRKFLKGSSSQVVFCTYQSSTLIEQAHQDMTVEPFDLAVADEAHRCTGKVGTDFTTVLDNSKIRSLKRLFTTATPRTYSSVIKKGAEELGVEVVGMDDEEVFGPVLHTLSFHEAINRKLLTDYRVIVIGVDDPMVSTLIQKRMIMERKDGVTSDAESIASQVGLLKAIKDYDLSRMISFHSRVSRAETFAREIQEVGGLLDVDHRPSGSMWADVVSGDMPTNRRKVKLDQLRSSSPVKRGLLTNAKCLSEGIDVPSLDGVAFIDPRSSQVDIIQAVGRAIRKSEDKTFGTIVLPVFIKSEDNPSDSIEASNFKPVWDVINALKAHDQDLALELEQLRTEMGKRSISGMKVEGLQKIYFDLPIKFDDSFVNQLKTMLVEQTTASWDFWLGVLLSWREIHGDEIPGVADEFNQYKLGIWVATQRANYQRGLLLKHRVQQLESLNGWTWNPVEDLWIQGFNCLKDFYLEFGHYSPPENYKSKSGIKLGSWVKTRRLDYSRNKLRSDKIQMLKALDGWSWDPSADAWNSNFIKICEAVKTKSLIDVEKGRTLNSEHKSLAVWIYAQKRNYIAWQNASKSNPPKYPRLDVEQVKLLESIQGWSWDRNTEAWNKNYESLKDFLLNNDMKLLKPATEHNGLVIGRWLVKQRSAYRSDKLEDWKLKLLEGIGCVMLRDPHGTRSNVSLENLWDAGFNKISAYLNANGHSCPSQSENFDEFPIGIWVSKQRQSYRKNKLKTERKILLESLTGWKWDATDQAAHSISKSGLSPTKLKMGKINA